MTRRDFDAQTKTNYGAPMPSDTRAGYRMIRNPGWNSSVRGVFDVLATREAWNRSRNDTFGVAFDGYLPVLGLGSPFRAGAVYRREKGLTLFGSKRSLP